MPGFLASLLPSLLSGVLGGLGGQGQSPSSAAPVDAGVQSAMGGSVPAPLQENPTGGSTFKTLLNDGIANGVKSLVGAGMNRWQAGNAGKDSRAYLNAQFPELNPWELAGVGASDAGVGLAGQDTQGSLQDKELATRVGMQDQQIAFGKEQLATQERMNAVSAAAGVQSASIGQGPAWARNPFDIELAQANADLARERAWRESVESAATSDRTTQSWIDSIPRILMSGYSAMGRVASAENFKRDALGSAAAGAVSNGVKSLVSGGSLGKLGQWFSKFRRPSGSAPSPRVEPVMTGALVE